MSKQIKLLRLFMLSLIIVLTTVCLSVCLTACDESGNGNDNSIVSDLILASDNKTIVGLSPQINSIEIIIPDGVTSIGNDAFRNCDNITSITIPNSVTSIGYSAFYKCSNLTSIIIPDSVTSVGYGAFYETAWYNNQLDGLIYAGKALYAYKGIIPKDEEDDDIVPDDKTINIKEGTKSITYGAFAYYSNLKRITIPSSVTNIGNMAFCMCKNLTEITFNGTKAQWTSIVKGDYWNSSTGDFIVRCTDGNLNKNGN